MNHAAGEDRLAVIIPSLNEAGTISGVLDSLAAQRSDFDRLVLADGGSTDGTQDIAAGYGAVVVSQSRRGRGCQIAAALAGLNEEIVIVLHADMVVPPGALALVRRALGQRADCPGGCLGHRFEGAGWLLALTQWWDERRARRGMSYGDQGQFFRRELLESAGGFPDQPIMEDVELSVRLRRLGCPAYLDLAVSVSARRFTRLGWFRTVGANFRIRLAYRLFGVRASERLYRRYYGDSGFDLRSAAR